MSRATRTDGSRKGSAEIRSGRPACPTSPCAARTAAAAVATPGSFGEVCKGRRIQAREASGGGHHHDQAVEHGAPRRTWWATPGTRRSTPDQASAVRHSG
ncbi:tyrosinase family oxidase copper chaperone [Streptomyces olivaceoviridis]